MNGSVFTSTTTWQPKKCILFSINGEIEFWFVFWLVLKCWINPSFINTRFISPTVVNDIHEWKDVHEYYKLRTQIFYLGSECFCYHVMQAMFSLCCAHWWVCFLFQPINIHVGQGSHPRGSIWGMCPLPWAQCPTKKSTEIKRLFNQEIFKSAAAQVDNLC